MDHARGFFQKYELHTGLRFIDIYEEEIITLVSILNEQRMPKAKQQQENRATLSLRNFNDGLKLQDNGDNSIYQDIDILFLVSDTLDELKIIHRILLTQLEVSVEAASRGSWMVLNLDKQSASSSKLWTSLHVEEIEIRNGFTTRKDS